MTVLAGAGLDRLIAIRHDLHAHPELQFKEHRTAGIVARELEACGVRVHTGMAGTAVIGTLTAGTSRRAIAIRADMDALPIHEQTNLPYASKTQGVMHACGHDGHTSMLLGAAQMLAGNPAFDGTVHFIFQPAEEDISGARRLIDEGLFERFSCDAVYALHNLPGEAVGQVRVRPGAITAAVDIVEVRIVGIGGHGAMPHKTADPLVAASSIVMALQTIVSRNVDPLEPAVITVGALNGGSNATIIPESCDLTIGVRSCMAGTRALLKDRIIKVITDQAASFNCRAEVTYNRGITYPPGVNSAAEADIVRQTALAMGQSAAEVDMPGPFMFSEDFAFMQEVKPSCYFGIGNGPSRNLHDAGYDFNDELLPIGAQFWFELVRRCLPQT
jgi:hippurate hydrolase